MATRSPKYAEGTEVPIDRSKAEIERVLAKYGASEFLYGVRAGHALVAFVAHGKQVRFILPMPNPDDFKKTPTGRSRKGGALDEAYEREMRRRWRALALVIKAKLEAVSTEIVSFEEEFLPYFVLPDGQTVGDKIIPSLEAAYKSGKLPKLLPDLRRD
jgi:hypothetical protein